MTGSTWRKAAHRCVHFPFTILLLMLPVTPRFAQTQGVGLLKVADCPLAEKFSARADLSFDPTSSRLYVADSAQGAVRIFDTGARAFVGLVPGLPGVDRLLALPEADAVYATATGAPTLRVIDTTAMSIGGTWRS